MEPKLRNNGAETVCVSVVIPAFNRAHVIAQAIDSVIAQAEGPFGSTEIIVVDDASSDDLAGSLARFGDRVRLLRLDRNGGAAAARNHGIAFAAGDYIALLDSDDAWLPGKLLEQIQFMKKEDLVACCTAFLLMKPQGSVVSPRQCQQRLRREDMVWGCFFSPGSTLIARRKLFEEIGLFDPKLRRFEDWDWLLRLSRKYDLGLVTTPLAKISPSDFRGKDVVLSALSSLRHKHITSMSSKERRHFAAALALERAAAYVKVRRFATAAWHLACSVLRRPFGHPGLAEILHNRSNHADVPCRSHSLSCL